MVRDFLAGAASGAGGAPAEEPCAANAGATRESALDTGYWILEPAEMTKRTWAAIVCL